MNSLKKYRINMSPEDFVKVSDIQMKIRFINDLIEEGLDFYPEVEAWLMKVLQQEKQTGLYDANCLGLEAELLLKLLLSVGKDIDELKTRYFLSKMYQESKNDSALFHIIEKIIVASLSDELEEVTGWALTLLTNRHALAGESDAWIYFMNRLHEPKVPYYIKEEIIIALGNRRSIKEINALIQFADHLIKVEAENEYDELITEHLKAKVAYGLGLTESDSAWESLEDLLNSSEDPAVEEAVTHAFERINEAKAKVEEAKFLIALWVSLEIIIKRRAVRGSEPPLKRLKKGDVIPSGQELRISFSTNDDAYIYLIYLNSQGELSCIFEGHITGNTEIEYPSGDEYLELDDIPGDEIIYGLACRHPFNDFDNRLKVLNEKGTEALEDIFPEAEVITFNFIHALSVE